MYSASRESTGARCSSRQECREVIAQKRTVVGSECLQGTNGRSNMEHCQTTINGETYCGFDVQGCET